MMTKKVKRSIVLRVTRKYGVFHVTLHDGSPVSETTVFLLCMMLQREAQSGRAERWELLASWRTVFVDGKDLQFQDSALSWVNVLFQQYLNRELKNEELVKYFDDVREWSTNALRDTFEMKPGPLTPRQADEVDAHFQEAMNQTFAQMVQAGESAPEGLV
jgi:hypothetical protein